MKIAVIDYNIGNVKSISNAFKKNGVDVNLTNIKSQILESDGLVLPGVGAFSEGMKNLKELDLINTIYEFIKTKKPFLGICLGMQLMLEKSEEFGIFDGLGLVKGKVIKLEKSENEDIPHISWGNLLSSEISWNNSILNGISKNDYVYFVHSYIAVPKNTSSILSNTSFGNEIFCSSIKQNNMYGCQFHPEKSGKVGLKIIENFIKICKESQIDNS